VRTMHAKREEDKCFWCDEPIHDGREESGSKHADWATEGGDFGCASSPETVLSSEADADEGSGSHFPVRRARRVLVELMRREDAFEMPEKGLRAKYVLQDDDWPTQHAPVLFTERIGASIVKWRTPNAWFYLHVRLGGDEAVLEERLHKLRRKGSLVVAGVDYDVCDAPGFGEAMERFDAWRASVKTPKAPVPADEPRDAPGVEHACPACGIPCREDDCHEESSSSCLHPVLRCGYPAACPKCGSANVAIHPQGSPGFFCRECHLTMA